jgi:hypothetical protein
MEARLMEMVPLVWGVCRRGIRTADDFAPTILRASSRVDFDRFERLRWFEAVFIGLGAFVVVGHRLIAPATIRALAL